MDLPAHLTRAGWITRRVDPLDNLLPGQNDWTGRSEGAVAVRSERYQGLTFNNYTKQDLEGLVHVLIYRIDLLLASLKLADWGNQDFTRTIEETETLLNEGTLYDIGRKMDHMIQAYESVATAAGTIAQYSMLSPGYRESTAQLEEALAMLNQIQRDLPVSTQSDHESEHFTTNHTQ